MSKREYRRFTAEQKIEILREADQPGVTERGVPAPRRLVALGPVPLAGGGPGRFGVALKRDAQRAPRKDVAEARHKAVFDRLRALVAEITAENLELKKCMSRPAFARTFSERKLPRQADN
jgi:hypothetical protein